MPTDIALDTDIASRRPASDLSSMSTQDLEALYAELQATPKEATPSPYGVGTALDVLGYQPGVVMSGLYHSLVDQGKVPAELAAKIKAKEEKAMKLQGPFPEATEYLTAAGYPIEHPAAQIAVNIAAPTALDVSTYTPLGLRTATGRVFNKVARPFATWFGKKVFESAPAIKRANIALKNVQKGPITEDLLQSGVYGTSTKLENESVRLARKSQNIADEMIKQTEKLGGKVPTDVVTKGPALDMAKEYSNALDPQMRELGGAMYGYLDDIAKLGNTISPTEATFVKGFHAKKGTYALYKDNPVWASFQRKLANSYREGVEQAATKVIGKDAGEALARQNARTGRLLEARKPLSRQSATDLTRPMLTQGDMALIAASVHPTARKFTLPVLGAKKTWEAMAHTLPRTMLGQTLYGGAKELAPLYPMAKHGFRLLGDEFRGE
jgi:hypothetical protein